jgi:hypothetical protein
MAKKKFQPKDFPVYLVSDPEQFMRLIIAEINYGDYSCWVLGCGTEVTEHFEHEISKERNQNILLGLEEKEQPEQS